MDGEELATRMVQTNDNHDPFPLAPPSEDNPVDVRAISISLEKQPGPERTAPMRALRSGTVVGGKFALIREIASGSMGTVFEAHDTLVDRIVALKLMHPYLNAKPDIVTRFLREAQAAARIRHPNVVAVLEMGKRRDGTFYIVQEMLTGRTLREYLNECGKLGPADTVSIALPIMGALATAHAARIVHRDVKPENMILWHAPSGERVPKLIDFGVAKFPTEGAKPQQMTHFGTLIGTPHYMSPEQAQGRSIDARTDVWAMGIVLFEMLTGEIPFPAESYEEVLMQIRTQDPMRIEDVLPSASLFGPLISRALQRSPDARFASMQQMREALETLRLTSPTTVSLPTSTNLDAANVTLPLSVREVVAEIALDIADLEPVSFEEEPPTVRAPSPSLLEQTLNVSRAAQQGAEWQMDREGRDSLVMGGHIDMAEHALSINALRPAIEAVDLGLLQVGLSAERCGKLWLVRAIAQRWLGEYEESARSSEKAMKRLVPGSTGWHAAFGHMLIAQSHLGQRDAIIRSVDRLQSLEEETNELDAAHVVSACRLTVCILRLGLSSLARSVFDRAYWHLANGNDHPAFVYAWVAVARAEFAVHDGDLTAYLRHVHTAVERFTSAGDLRNASLQRSNIGNALMLLGGYEHACTVFEETIRMALPMQLDFVHLAHCNLAHSLALLNRLDAARNAAEAALTQARAQGHRRCEAMTLVYAARIRARAGDFAGALAASTEAERVAEHFPAIRAYALGVSASLHYGRRQFSNAEKLAHQAMDIVERLRGIEEGEALVRLVYAQSLRARGCEIDAKRILREARAKLLATAQKIGDDGWRKSFLTNVPDNGELLRVALEWLGPVESDKGGDKRG